MTVRNGRDFLAIPGPTVVPDAVLKAMHAPAIDIYAGPLVAMTDSLLADLRAIFRTEGRVYIYAANGHGAWEAALVNTLSRDDRVLTLDCGRFAAGWGEMAAALGMAVESLPGSWTRAVDADALRAFAATRLADFKVPRTIVFVDAIPKGATGKIQRIGLASALGLGE